MGAKRVPKAKAIEATVISDTEGASSIEIGKRLNMPSSTIRNILSGGSSRWSALRQDSAYLTYKQECTRQLQTAYSEMVKQSLEQAERMLPNASYAAAMVGGGIAFDKLSKLNEIPANLP
jgi:hypothetical protein